jgi:hypothetical protein
MDALLLLLLKATLLLSLPLLAARLLRRAPAAVRHGLCTLTFAAVLALPFLASTLPTLAVPVSARWSAALLSVAHAVPDLRELRDVSDTGAPRPPDAAPANSVGASDDTPAIASASTPGDARVSPGRVADDVAVDSRMTSVRWPTARVVMSVLWLVGTIVATTVLIVSLVRVWRLARTAEELTDPEWREAADALGARLGLRRSARLLASARVGTPMAAGVWRPLVFLPATAREWTAECRDVVLAHEMAHLAVRDPLRHLTARLAVACYWFHPLAWLAAREATMARERRVRAGAGHAAVRVRASAPRPRRIDDPRHAGARARRAADGGTFAAGDTTHGHPECRCASEHRAARADPRDRCRPADALCRRGAPRRTWRVILLAVTVVRVISVVSLGARRRRGRARDNGNRRRDDRDGGRACHRLERRRERRGLVRDVGVDAGASGRAPGLTLCLGHVSRPWVQRQHVDVARRERP